MNAIDYDELFIWIWLFNGKLLASLRLSRIKL